MQTSRAYGQSVFINEVMAVNGSTLSDEDGEFSDWIELHNPGATSINLAGWHLSDDSSDPTMWVFPSVDIPASGYLVVFASNKDRRVSGSELHTNFKLASDGDFLGLFDSLGDPVMSFDPQFPRQYENISWGLSLDDASLAPGYFEIPSPNLTNPTAQQNYKALPPVFSQERGYYSNPFNLLLVLDEGDTIRYSLDGTEPSDVLGTIYTGPIQISSTTVVRAVASGVGYNPSEITTHTFVFLDEAINSALMDPAIVNDPIMGPQMNTAFTMQNAVFLTTPDTLNIDNEIQASVEYFDPSGVEDGFQANCGAKYVGGHSINFPKISVRLYFREEWGQSKLEYPLFQNAPEYQQPAAEKFDQIHLRSGSHDTQMYWGWEPGDRNEVGEGQWARNRWMHDMQFRMEQPAIHGNFVHLFVNGAYHGQYHMGERPTKSYMTEYFDGGKDDFAYTNKGVNDDVDIWAQVRASAYDYPTASSWIDIDNVMDYFLLQYYAGNDWDWLDTHNWMAAGGRTADSTPWKIFSWDADIVLAYPEDNAVDANDRNGTYNPRRFPVDSLMSILSLDAEFRMRFSDRANFRFNNGGVLTDAVGAAQYIETTSPLATSLIPEIARWRRSFPSTNYNLDTHWEPERQRILNQWFPGRVAKVLEQLREAGLYPSINPPSFSNGGSSYNQFEGSVGAGFQLTIDNLSNTDLGTIYYTIDGSDPRAAGGAIQGANAADLTTFTIAGTVTVNARIFEAGEWSALQTATFFAPQMLDKLVINEIHYHPLDEGVIGFPDYVDGDEFEFIEIKNTAALALQLQGVRFTEGIEYTFPAGSEIPANGFFVIAENTDEFLNRYGFAADGKYNDKLSNSGEKLVLNDFAGVVLDSLTYRDGQGWNAVPDGDGPSLSLDPAAGINNNDPSTWFASEADGGTPGSENVVNFPPLVVINFPTHQQRFNTNFAFSIQVGAADANDSIDSVSVSIGDFVLGHDYQAPWSFNWTPPPGEYDLVATAWDTFLQRGISDTVHVLIANENACVAQLPLVINEINYNDDDVNGPLTGDWIELYNPNANAISLSAWTFKDSKDENWMVLPSGTSIPGFGYHVLVQDDVLFSQVHSISNKSASFEWGLDGSGDHLRLYTSTGCLIDEVSYDDESPWPLEADGQGSSLELVNPDGDNNLAVNWQASPGGGGTPGVVNSGLEILVDLLTPANNTGLNSGSPVFVTARVQSGPAVSVVDVFLDGALVGQMTVDPNDASLYTYELSGLADGVYNIDLKARNASGQFDLSNSALICVGVIGLGAYAEGGGQVVFEAEGFSNKIDRDTDTWEEASANPGYVGSYMVTLPDDGTKFATGYAGTVSELQYLVNFETLGTYYLWYRGWADDGSNNSVHFGLDGAETPTLQDVGIGVDGLNSFSWTSSINDGTRARVDITTPGLHNINLWLREDGTGVDRVILTTNPDYVPDGVGPEASAQEINKVRLSTRVILSGAWNVAAGNMRTDLNAAELLPLTQPYASVPDKTVASDFFDTNTNIVDWVWLELRTGLGAVTSIYKEAFLLREDGWLVNPSGSSELGLNGVAEGNYHVVIGHRNHLSVISSSTYSLESENFEVLDLTSTLASMHSIDADPAVALSAGVFGLWSGDATGNGEVKYTASGNDRVEILNIAGGPTPFDTAIGYFAEDINLDGIVKYAGANNDRVEVLGTAGGPSAFDSRKDQVPD